MSEKSSVSACVQAAFPQRVLGLHRYRGEETVVLAREGLLEVCRFLRDDPRAAFNFLMDLTCVDYLAFGKRLESMPTLATPSPLPYFMKPAPTDERWERFGDRAGAIPAGEEVPPRAGGAAAGGARFEIVYHLYSLTRNHRLRVKVPVSESDPVVESVTSLWRSADWFEREIWDMFGIRFTGHPNLKRILMYEPFAGHPLRKDYPIRKRQPLIGPVN